MKTINRINANHLSISVNGIIEFISYESLIVTIDMNNHIIVLGDDWNYSRTTAKYRGQFFKSIGFDELSTTAAIEKAIKAGCVSINGTEYKVGV